MLVRMKKNGDLTSAAPASLYRYLLSALRPLLFREPADVSTAPESGTSIPASLVIHFLFALVGANVMASPRTIANKTHSQVGVIAPNSMTQLKVFNSFCPLVCSTRSGW